LEQLFLKLFNLTQSYNTLILYNATNKYINYFIINQMIEFLSTIVQVDLIFLSKNSVKN